NSASRWSWSSCVPPGVGVRLAFNLPVVPDAAFFGFVDNKGRKVPAAVRAATAEDYFQVAPAEDDWNMRWKLAADPSATPANGTTARIVVTPASPLPLSDGWKLQVKAGLPAAEGDLKLAGAAEIAVGRVSPLALSGVECGNYVNSGPTATMTFDRNLAPDITSETAAQFFAVRPEVPGLEWEIGYDTVVARGKFEIGREYTLRIGDKVVSGSGEPFAGEREVPLVFSPAVPRLYLPELTMSQILGGRRLLPVRSVNLLSLRVRAVLLPPGQALRALSVFAENEWKYFNGQPVPATDFSGTTLVDETIAVAGPQIDKSTTTDLDWTRILGGKKAGFVYLEVTGEPLAAVGGKKCAAQALVQLTDLGVLWSKAGNDVGTFVFSNTTGKPVAGAQVQLLDAAYEPLAGADTDGQGSAKLGYGAVPRWLLVKSGGDACALPVGPGARALPTGAWYSDWAIESADEAGLRGMIFTDRPLYQPEENVRIKGYLRSMDEEGMQTPPGRELQLQLRDTESNAIATATVTTDERGAFDSALVLPAGPLGRYVVSLENNGNNLASASFLVAAYQPDAFEVSLAIPEELPAGAPAPVARAGGRYFFGGKVTDAEVRWSLRYFQTFFAPEGFEDFRFLVPSENEEEAAESKPLTLRGEGKIAAGREMDIAPKLPVPVLAPFRGALTAEVTDINQQTVSRTAEFTRESSDFYLGINRGEERVVRIGEEIPLQVVAVQPDGRPLAGAVDVKVNIWRWRYNVVRELGAGGAMTFRTETIEEPVLEQTGKTLVPTKQGGSWNAGEGKTLGFKAAALGHHRIRVTARDAGGREVVSESSFYVSGEGDTVWDYRNPFAIDLVPDKSSYQPGETARILLKTPIEGEAVVNVQRGDAILRTLRVPVTGNAPVIEVPLGKKDAPNVTVAIVILRGSDASPRKFPMPEFRFGSCDLEIEQPDRVLQVSIGSARKSVQPGEDVECAVEVRDHRGKPVAGAGVTFYAVDDGVVSLVGFERPDPAQVFLQPVANRVLLGLSLADLLPEDPQDLTFANKGYLIGGGGQEGPVALRENFPGTACWLPSLLTGPDGRVVARFTAPDALTRYRLVAVAAAGPDAFGTAESSVEISKPLMLLPSLGQFANEGDDLVARAVIRNATGADGDVDVSLKTPAGTEKKMLRIASGASAAADFPLVFNQPGDIDLEWTARMTAGGQTFSDGARTRLPVGSPMVKLNEIYFAQLGDKANDLLAGVNPQLIEGRGTVAVTVANTRLVSLGQGARYLVEYPYGCAEQKTSSLVPWIVMPVLGPLMPGFARDAEEIARVTNKTIFELFQLQTSDGGLGFWPGSTDSALFPSAWAGIVLSMASSEDTKLPPQWNNLLEYLAKSLRGMSEDKSTLRLSDRAFAAYALALAGRPEAAYHEELFRRRADLPRDARAVLALAIAASGGPREMSEKLLSGREPAPEDSSPFADAARERSIRLLAVGLLDPAGKEIGPLVAEVLKLGARGQPVTTQSSAWTLLALASYRDSVENKQKGPRDAAGTMIAGDESAPFRVSGKKPAAQKTFPISPGAGAMQKLLVENPATAPLYGETSFEVYPPLGAQPRQDRGFAVSRSYRKMTEDGSTGPAEDLRVGDRIIVTLRVESTRPSFFVAVDDPLPSILEAVNPEFVSRQSGEIGSGAGTGWVSHCEMRADRVLYFCDTLPPGAHTFEYLARVRVAGKAAAGATKAGAMYRPEKFGLGTIDRLSSRPASTP
ncbi:MAG: hypothetical protein JHD33_01740, partial [Chthoniobacterales bacterium]|nr:hypothetical protein [Chthoniobacterales bacterium]